MEIENCQMRGRPVVLRSLPVNLRGSGWSDLVTRILRIILQEKNGIPLSRYNLVHNFVPMRQVVKYQMQKQQWEKLWKTGEIPAWQLTKVRNKNEMAKIQYHILKTRKTKSKQGKTFCVVTGSLSSSELVVGATVPEIQRPSCIPRVLLWKMIQDHVQYSLSKDLRHHKWRKVAKVVDAQD